MEDIAGKDHIGTRRPGSTGGHDGKGSTFLWDEYRRFHETAPIGYFTLDREARIIDVNVAGAKMLGSTPPMLLGKDLKHFVVDEPEGRCEALVREILDRDEWQECEAELKRTDGSRLFASLQGRQIALAREIVIFATDITTRKAAENALRESEQKYREVADRLAEGVFEADTKGVVTYANQKVMSSLGLGPDDLKNGLKVFDVVAPQDLALAVERMGRVLEREDVGAGEYLLVRKDGKTVPSLVHSLAIVRDGKVVGVRGIMIDISERKQAETALQESERKYRELTELLGSGVFELDTNGTVTYANRKGLELFRLGEEQIKKGFKVFDVVIPEDVSVASENFSRLIKSEEVGPVEYTARRTDGSTFPALTYSSPIVRDGVVVGVRGVVVDISELKQTERALRDSERRYRELADLLDEGVVELDLEAKFTYANRKAMTYLGIDENDINGTFSVFDIVANKDLERARERMAAALNEQDTGAVEFEIVRKGGTTFAALTHGSAIVRDGAVVGIRGVIFDISDLKRVETALRESEERFRTFVSSLHEGIWVLDKEDRTVFVNPRMAEMLGYTELEMVGQPVFAFSGEQWREASAHYMQRRRQGIKERIEIELLRKDGGRVYASLETSPILDAEGKYAGSIAGVQDITARRLDEERLKRAMAELDRSNKELEQFAYVTSHDLREPLRMMTSFSQSLEKRYRDKLDATANEYIHFVVDGAARMQRLIDDILVYSRVSTRGQPFESVTMQDLVQEVFLNLKAAIDETGARIVVDPLPMVEADPSQMKQVMQNLVANAVKFHKRGTPPEVRVTAVREGPEWVFSVKDNGIGIDPQMFGRLFNLFQRLHSPEEYPGTGVGLAVTKKIIQRHGGRIWVESEPEKGASFYFTLPVVRKATADDKE